MISFRVSNLLIPLPNEIYISVPGIRPKSVATIKELVFIDKIPGTIFPNHIGKRGKSLKEISQVKGLLLKLEEIEGIYRFTFFLKYSDKNPLEAKKTTEHPRVPKIKHAKKAE